MDKRATCRKILRKTALSVLAASILMAGTVDAVRAEETPNVLQTVEAESGTLLGKAKIAATGTCVSGLEHTGDGVEVTVTVPEDGLYDIIVRTAVIGGGTKVNEVNANGQHVGDITNSGSWSDEVVPYVWLEAGENTVSVTTSYGWIAVDSFSIRRAAPLPADVYEVKPTLINPNATAQRQAPDDLPVRSVRQDRAVRAAVTGRGVRADKRGGLARYGRRLSRGAWHGLDFLFSRACGERR